MLHFRQNTFPISNLIKTSKSMALISGKLIFEVSFEELAVPLNHFTQMVIQRACAEQIFYHRPWANPEDAKNRRPNFKIVVTRPKPNQP